MDIAALASRAGLSMRQFERRFIQQVGMRPKMLARVARFEAALEAKARRSTKSWTDVAHEFGYYDQMHMVHDFKEFTGGRRRRPSFSLKPSSWNRSGQFDRLYFRERLPTVHV